MEKYSTVSVQKFIRYMTNKCTKISNVGKEADIDICNYEYL